MEPATSDLAEALRLAAKAFHDDDAAAFRQVLERFPELKAKINEPVAEFGAPIITQVRSGTMLDVLLEAGADVNARSDWWAGGFGLLDSASPELAAHALNRGAVLTVHAAARLGMLDALRELIAARPELVHARGGDGQTPLHFAATVPIAEYLLDHGADIDARDIDHESTPAQYMLEDRQEIARYLISRGTRTDLLMAAALGDIDLARQLLDDDPASIRLRVSDEYFPMIGSGKSGGTIYQWQLGWYVSAAQVAHARGFSELFQLLMQRSPADERLLNACWLHDDVLVNSLLAQDPNLSAALPVPGRRHLAHAARNNDTAAARLMLRAGLPVNTFGQHHATPLHWAAWHGNTELVVVLLSYDPPLEDADNEFKGTPLNWSIHGSENGWHRQTGDYGGVVEALLATGAVAPKNVEGSEAVKSAFRRNSPE